MNATAKQLQCIHAALHRQNLLYHKADFVSSFTNGRTESSKEMTIEEASALLQMLNEQQQKDTSESVGKDKMIRQIVAIAREMGVVVRYQAVEGDQVKTKSDYRQFNEWLLTKSCVKKAGLNLCSYKELQNLVTQYKAIYQDWLKKPKNHQP